MTNTKKNMKIELCLFLVLALTTSVVSAISRPTEQEIQNHLKRLNKPAVKSIKSSDGDIIDCVNIADQPAFDHPLLKNHMIQLSPTHDPDWAYNKQSENEGPEPITQLWQLNGTCPQGTVPIIRTTRSDLLRASSLEEFGKKPNATISQPGFSQHSSGQSRYEHAMAYVKGGSYYGTKADLNVWNPYVNNNEFSASRIWVAAGGYPPSDVIEAGWHVDPQANGDHNTRFFIYWISDGFKHTGCFNQKCPGFVQTTHKVALGVTINPVSHYMDNVMQSIELSIWKDKRTKNWWLKYEKTVIGYWPSSLFGLLDQSASEVHWGGEVLNRPLSGLHTTTDMGSGRFAQSGWQKASYIKRIQIADEEGNFRDPIFLDSDAKNPGCYNIRTFEDGGFTWGKYIFFGGPGRNPKCH